MKHTVTIATCLFAFIFLPASTLFGQGWPFSRGCKSACGCQCQSSCCDRCGQGQATDSQDNGTDVPTDEDDFQIDIPNNRFAALGGDSVIVPNMAGDSINGSGITTHMGYGDTHESAVGLYSFHTFKISEDESPFPRSRLYFDVNTFSNVPGTDSLTRFMIGGEKAFFDEMVSIGLRLPIWAVDVEETPTSFPASVPFGPGGANTDIGDLTVTLKAALLRCSDRLLSAGLSVTSPTGPDTLADVAPYYTFDTVEHKGGIQSWVGWYLAANSPECGWFTQGFAAIETPFDKDDADYFYLDFGIGHRTPWCGGCITAVTPIVEVHWSAPMNNKEQLYTLTPLATSTLGNAGIPSLAGRTLAFRHQVNLTFGVNLELQNTQSLTLGFVVPTTGPRVMDFELLAQYNMFGW